MRPAPLFLATQPFTTLPDALRYRGKPSAWAGMTRPGQDAFLSGSGFFRQGPSPLAVGRALTKCLPRLTRRIDAEGRPAEEIECENYTDVAALKRWVAPEEVGRAALYYASDMTSAITGDKMKVDCGRF